MSSIKIDPVTKDYSLDTSNGKLENDLSLKTPAYFRLMIPRLGWLYAPDRDYGSDLALIKKNLTSGGSSIVSNTAERALNPLIDQERASSVSVDVVQKSRHGVGIEIDIVDANGEEEKTYFVPIGNN